MGHELVQGADEAGHLLQRGLPLLADDADVGALLVADPILVDQLDELGLLADDDAVVVEECHGPTLMRGRG